ncbi:flippase [Candidatus Nanosalina sp. VS9-1]|uniref:flippase n=1 Tax=Candidatus Nanosalina sp. VS9-1 TaxID=3388566 RepID=UPI0039E1942A
MPEDENREILNTLAKGAGITAFGMFASKFLTYLYRALVGRTLGPEAYGQLALGIMIVNIAVTFSGGQIRNGLKKFIPEYREERNTAAIKGIVISALGINIIGSIIIGLTIFFSAEFLANQIFKNPALVPIIKVFAFVPLISRPYNTFIDTTIGFNTAKYKVITTNFFQNIVQLIVTAVLIYVGFDVMGAVWGWVAGVTLAGILGFYYMERKVGPILTSGEKPEYHGRELVRYSFPLMLSGMVSIFMGWTDTAFLGYYMSESVVGLYNAAFPTAMLILIPIQALGSLTLTSFAEQNTKDENPGKTLKTTARWVFIFTFPAFLIMTLYSSELLHLLFGSKFASAGTALAVLALGNMLGASTGHIADLLKSKGHTKPIFYNNIANVVLNIILNIALIPTLGMLGAAIATASSSIFMNFLLVAETWRYEKIHPFTRKIIKPAAAGTISLTATYLLFHQLISPAPYWLLIPAGIIFLGLYTLILLKIGGLTEYDREIITTIGRKIGYEKEVEKMLKTLT